MRLSGPRGTPDAPVFDELARFAMRERVSHATDLPMARARSFPGCRYGVFALRPLLRDRLQPGERILGMGAADTAGPGRRAMALATPLLPLGWIAGSRALRRRRILVVTDRRVLILGPDRPEVNGSSVYWNAEIPLSQVEIERVTERRLRFDAGRNSFEARLRGRWLGAELSTVGPASRGPRKAR